MFCFRNCGWAGQRWLGILPAILMLISAVLTRAQDEATTAISYQMPPQAIADLVEAPRTPLVSISPDKKYMVMMRYPMLISIEDLSEPELRLAGLRINPRTNGPSRDWYFNEIKFKEMPDGDEYPVSGLPQDPHISNVDWSPDSRWIAFTLILDDRLELWAAEVKNGQAQRLSSLPLNAAHGSPYTWLSNSQMLVAKTVPADRGGAPEEPSVPPGPVVQENLGAKAPAATYQDLLENAYDEDVFEFYATSQIVTLALDGKSSPLGARGIIESITPSPSGKYLLVETVHRPFSYTVPVSRFPRRIEVWDLYGNIVYQVADLPLAEEIPITFGSVRTGRREVGWRNDGEATLWWVEALDGGDAGADAEERDRVYVLEEPFDGDPLPLITLSQRFYQNFWGDDDLAIVSEWWWPTRNIKAWHVYPGKPEREPDLLIDRSWEDRYNDPGWPLMTRTAYGTRVLLTADNGKTLFLSGDGASSEGDRPFLDEFNVGTHETKRLFRSEEPYFESPMELLDAKKRILITRRESVDEPPNYFIRKLKKNELEQITFFPHPTPQLKDVTKELIRYERADGVQMTATLYLPPGYTPEQGPLPVLMWAYPQEYKSADAAGQVTDSPYRFIRVGWYSPLLWLVHGYAILDDPTMPIVGEGEEEPNDTYVEQLVSSAQAAVDELVRRGVGDRDRMAIGGHSYGAFMAANLLAHSDLYRAAIARSGAYNRTLTPFGFQAEERTLWEAPDVYFAMSPFMNADKINEPILLIHGEADNNSGTYPLQSERFYGALKGHGATVRLVMLPHESHSYRARESVMHVLWEMTEWLDTYVKNAPKPEETVAGQEETGG